MTGVDLLFLAATAAAAMTQHAFELYLARARPAFIRRRPHEPAHEVPVGA
ncbi:hypothetical protein [Kitasatospora sp. NPDC002040]